MRRRNRCANCGLLFEWATKVGPHYICAKCGNEAGKRMKAAAAAEAGRQALAKAALDILASHDDWEQDAYEMVQAIAVAARTLGLVEADDRFIPKGAS